MYNVKEYLHADDLDTINKWLASHGLPGVWLMQVHPDNYGNKEVEFRYCWETPDRTVYIRPGDVIALHVDYPTLTYWISAVDWLWYQKHANVVAGTETMSDDLKKLMEEATPGPWEVEENHGTRRIFAEGHPWALVSCCDKLVRPEAESKANAALIAAAVNAVPELLALREEVGRLRELAPRLILTGLQAGRASSKAGASLMWDGELASDAHWSREAARAALNQETKP